MNLLKLHIYCLVCSINAASCVQVLCSLVSHQNNKSKMKIGLLCRLRGEDGPRERPREWQLALANRTTANGTPHLLLSFSCPPPIPVPTSGLSGKCSELPCCLASHHLITLFTPTHPHSSEHLTLQLLVHEIKRQTVRLGGNQQWKVQFIK